MLTIWILIAAYEFVVNNVAAPINRGVREVWLQSVPWPEVTPVEVDEHRASLDAKELKTYEKKQAVGTGQRWLVLDARRAKLKDWWEGYGLVLDLIGLIVAIVIIYFIGLTLGTFIGRRLYARGERLVTRVPLVSRVYPSVKQVTDFFFSDGSDRIKFNRVVAVEYPRKGLWSVGLVTGSTMRAIQVAAGKECLTVFVPSSPTPFTGYVITVPESDTIDLGITIEDALKFAVSGGVLVPPSQQLRPDGEEPSHAPPRLDAPSPDAGAR